MSLMKLVLYLSGTNCGSFFWLRRPRMGVSCPHHQASLAALMQSYQEGGTKKTRPSRISLERKRVGRQVVPHYLARFIVDEP